VALHREILRIRLVRLSPDALRKPSPPAQGVDVPELAVDGTGLPTLLSVLAGAERERLAAIEEQFKKAVPTLDGFRILPTPEGNHRLVFKLAGDMGQVEASQVSDGAMLFLGFLSLLHHPSPASVLLIEEPETGVHPGRLKSIVKLLRTLTVADGDRPAVQIVMTTHSPYLLDELRPEEVLVFRRDEHGAADAIRMDSIPDINERLNDYSPGELWAAYEEDRLHELSKGK
jgi:predicted ATPase